jgi:hypothetical protein
MHPATLVIESRPDSAPIPTACCPSDVVRPARPRTSRPSRRRRPRRRACSRRGSSPWSLKPPTECRRSSGPRPDEVPPSGSDASRRHCRSTPSGGCSRAPGFERASRFPRSTDGFQQCTRQAPAALAVTSRTRQRRPLISGKNLEIRPASPGGHSLQSRSSLGGDRSGQSSRSARNPPAAPAPA